MYDLLTVEDFEYVIERIAILEELKSEIEELYFQLLESENIKFKEIISKFILKLHECIEELINDYYDVKYKIELEELDTRDSIISYYSHILKSIITRFKETPTS